MFSMVCFLQYKIGLSFWLGFDPEKVTPAISEPWGGYSVDVVYNMSLLGLPSLVVASTESRGVLSFSAVPGVGTV